MTIHRLGAHTPQLPSGFYWIAPNAAVLGRVRLGEDVSVWFSATIRGDVEDIVIGAGSNIQDNAVLHADPGFPLNIGSGCTIGHSAIVHGCTIGDNSLVGMGATVLNGARIGRDCLIGANALITEGKVIPDGSLVVGTPGKVVRALTPEDIAGLGRSAAHYVNNARRFAADLQPL